jgi:hypothetical protein
VPLVMAGVYAAGSSPLISAVLLVVGITAFGYVIARMRLETGSVWPAIVLHTAWNSIIIRGFDPATTGSGAMLWVGESGILTTLALVVAAVVFSRGRWTILGEPPESAAHSESQAMNLHEHGRRRRSGATRHSPVGQDEWRRSRGGCALGLMAPGRTGSSETLAARSGQAQSAQNWSCCPPRTSCGREV